MEKVAEVTRNLDNVIDINAYPTPKHELSNKKHRPLGIGFSGLADILIRLKIPYESEQAFNYNRNIMAAMYYAAIKESNKLAIERGTYESFKGSPMSEGKFQFDLWNDYGTDLWKSKIRDVAQYPATIDSLLNWEELRTNIIKYGLRNSLLIALMPTATSGRILGNTECFEPIISNMYTKKIISGTFLVVNYFLINDLRELGLWNPDMLNKIKANEGSIAGIEEIPKNLRDVYKTVYEMDSRKLVELRATRGCYVCQSESSNVWIKNKDDVPILDLYAYELGCKAGAYYTFIDKAAKGAKLSVKKTITVDVIDDKKDTPIDNLPLFCDRSNPDCEACKAN
jgi:ribonucleoside-diphosphate reductase alpha chain